MVRALATSDPTMTGTLSSRHTRAVRLWLYAVAALVLAMVLVGGATRLTESGLSITEWKPVTGVVPPLSQDAWQAAFVQYQATPQYRAMNSGMSLEAFKTIYWWEWAHRLLGRVIGLAFLLPFLFFLWRGWVAPSLRPRLWFIFVLGALQGAVGWWMVASGLADRVEVSQYRLATHLLLACLIYVALILTALRLDERTGLLAAPPGRVRGGAVALLVLVLAQIYLGALVAGLRAGYAYNTWPLIDGALVPDGARLFFETPLWRNFFENILTAQFDHRMLAYAIFVIALLQAIDVASAVKERGARIVAFVLFAVIVAQIAFGILVWVVPLSLALLHQAMAMLVLTAASVHAAFVQQRVIRPLIPAQAGIQPGSPLSRGRAG
jgi:heme a synthase